MDRESKPGSLKCDAAVETTNPHASYFVYRRYFLLFVVVGWFSSACPSKRQCYGFRSFTTASFL